jgi:hypothetical protein
MARSIILPRDGTKYKMIEKDGSIQIWRQSTNYDVTWLTNRLNKIEETITLLKNANIQDSIFKAIALIAKELTDGTNYNESISYKQNVINRLIQEKDTINWLLVLGSSSSSSSSISLSSSSSSSFSLPSEVSFSSTS